MPIDFKILNKFLVILTIVTLGLFAVGANKAQAIEFNFINPLDPFCLFSCNNNEKVGPQKTYNNYNYSNQTNNNNQYSSLYVSCYPTPTGTGIGSLVSWRSSVSGGNGFYTYSWSGTDGLSGSSSFIDRTYSSVGSKSGSITVTSGDGQSMSRSCSSNVTIYDYTNYYNNNYNNGYYNNNYSPLLVSCRADSTSINPGSYVTWYASVSGGTGSYTYSWTGNDNLYSYQSYVNKYYDTYGQKYATLTVYSGSQQVTVQCTNSVYVAYPSNYNSNYYYNQPVYQPYPTVVYPNQQVIYGSNTTSGIQLACFANETATTVSSPVTWTAEATGGYISSYLWKGSEGLSGNQSSVVINYLLPGTKTASIVAYTTTGQQISKACSNSVIVKDTYTKPTTVKSIKPASTNVTKTKDVVTPNKAEGSGTSISSLFSLSNVPWSWVLILVIVVLGFIIVYLMVNKKNL